MSKTETAKANLKVNFGAKDKIDLTQVQDGELIALTKDADNANKAYGTKSDGSVGFIDDITISSSGVVPTGANTDLGSSTNKFKDLYLSGQISDGTNSTTVSAINNNVAPTYDPTQTYSVGDLVLHDGILYKCNTAITTAESWDSEKWTATKVSQNLGIIKFKASDLGNSFTDEQIGIILNNIVYIEGTYKGKKDVFLIGTAYRQDMDRYEGFSIITSDRGKALHQFQITNQNVLIYYSPYIVFNGVDGQKSMYLSYTNMQDGGLIGFYRHSPVTIKGKLLPDYPTTDGNYHLEYQVVSGVGTLVWVLNS